MSSDNLDYNSDSEDEKGSDSDGNDDQSSASDSDGDQSVSDSNDDDDQSESTNNGTVNDVARLANDIFQRFQDLSGFNEPQESEDNSSAEEGHNVIINDSEIGRAHV